MEKQIEIPATAAVRNLSVIPSKWPYQHISFSVNAVMKNALTKFKARKSRRPPIDNEC